MSDEYKHEQGVGCDKWKMYFILSSKGVVKILKIPQNTLNTCCTDTDTSREPRLWKLRRPTANSRPAFHRCVPNPISFTTHTHL
jgi:hypothetical protein